MNCHFFNLGRSFKDHNTVRFVLKFIHFLVIDEGWTDVKGNIKREKPRRFNPRSASTPTETSNRYSSLFVDEEIDCISSETLSSEETCHDSKLSSTDSVVSGKFNTFNLRLVLKIHHL